MLHASDIENRLNQMTDRCKEILGERAELNHKLDNNAIDTILYQLKIVALDYELKLMEMEVDKIKTNIQQN